MENSGASAPALQPLLRNGVGNHVNAKNRIRSGWLRSAAKWTLKTVMWTLLVFWIALFFMVPNGAGSDIFNDWVTATEGTLFGSVGVDLLLYGGPILLIALLAVPYLLLSDEDEEQLQPQEKKGKPQFRLSTFPVLVDGIFGVVSAGELIVIALFAFFVIWAVYNYTVTNYAILPSYGDLTPGEERVQMLQMTAYIFGLTASSCLAFLFLPVARGSILLRLVDIPFEHATKYHVWLGNLTMFLLTMHGTCYMIVWIIRHIVLISIVEWKSDGGANCAGIIAYSFGFAMWVTTFPPIRKRYFELFFYTHQLYVFFIIFFALHVGDANFSKIFGGVFLFMLDRFLRFFQSRRNADVISATCFPCGTVGVVISKPKCLHYNALGFIFIRIKELSKLQWHPFSVSSSPQDGKYHLSVLMKVAGDWTEKLMKNVSNQDQAEDAFVQSPLKIQANVEGPYGHESPYHLMYEKLILVAGGSGISPFIAILSDILHRVKNDKPCLPRQVLLVWAIKKSSEISLLSSLDIKSIHPILLDKLQVEIRIFVTQETQPSLEEGRAQNVLISSRSTPFRKQSMSILVGTGDKLWAGAYVLVPILGFILITGLLDVFYLNPYDISAWWYRGILLVICMVLSVVIFGGLVIALWSSWEKKLSSLEEDDDDRYENFGTILQNEELSTKDVIRDFDSFTNINYGNRPNFRDIFGSISECWGCADVGVVVCGPQTLQSSVARECRSQGLRRRDGPIFHFHSHSFDL